MNDKSILTIPDGLVCASQTQWPAPSHPISFTNALIRNVDSISLGSAEIALDMVEQWSSRYGLYTLAKLHVN